MRFLRLALSLTALACLSTACARTDAAPAAPVPVSVVQLPDGGIQPQASADAAGVVHVVYFRGTPAGGDLFHATLSPKGQWSRAVRVNSLPGSAIATGSVRGAQLAVGANGLVHVAWNGSGPVETPAGKRIPMWYARSNAAGSAFEAQRALMTWTDGLDGGGAIAADASGRVVVAWHGMGTSPGEARRTVYVAKSSDAGRTFAREARATDTPIGSCGCCGMRALIDGSGTLQILYRAATDGIHRDATWLSLGATAPVRSPVRVHPWKLEACPMTTFALAEGAGALVAAWETQQQIYSASLDPATGAVSGLALVPGAGIRKHPSLAINAKGDRLLAWTEGTAWNRGGIAAWRLVDRDGTERAAAVDAGPVPVWGLVAAAARVDGSFVIVR